MYHSNSLPPWAPAMATITLFTHHAKFELALFPTTACSPCHGSLCPSVELHCRASQAGLCTQLEVRQRHWCVCGKLARVLGNFNLIPPPFLGEWASMCTLFTSRALFLIILLSVSLVSNQLRELIFLMCDTRAGTPSMWIELLTSQRVSKTMQSPSSSVSPPWVQVLTWWFLFPSYMILCGSFLQPLLYKNISSSVHFCFIFIDNCSTCRSFFDVFMEVVVFVFP